MRLYKYFLGLPGGDWIEGFVLARSRGRALARILKKINPTWYAIGKPNREEVFEIGMKLLLGLAAVAYVTCLVIGKL